MNKVQISSEAVRLLESMRLLARRRCLLQKGEAAGDS
jgi:hypothetical protein